ncbi:MAG: glycoside hydrolase family 3 N-terminal domain-containing protein [Candidatus Nanopelagicales bacterium]
MRLIQPSCAAVAAAALLTSGCSWSPQADPVPPAGSTTPAPSAPAPDPSESADPELACVARLPLDVRIGQTMLVTTTDLPRVQPWLEDGLIAGVLSNGRLTRATATLLEVATAGTRYGALLAADEEGGPVSRYAEVIGAIPSAQRQATTMTPEAVRQMYAEHGQALADWGVDLVFAPVVDVGHGPGIGPRAYSEDPDVVTDFGTAAAQGYSGAGLLPVLKHFPGQGRATADTHYELAVGPPIDELRAVDMVPFGAIPGAVDVGVMVGHTTIPGYSDTPASQSTRTIGGLLVDELGFEGLIVSDALGMAASGEPTQGDALVGFIAAGGDLGIVGPGGSQEGRRALRSALEDGTVSRDRLDDAAGAVLAAKGVDPCRVAGRPAPEVADETDGPSDGPVINPTEEP